jgi:hypothetical protein
MPIGPTGDRAVAGGDVLFGMMDERKHAICRVTVEALIERGRRDGVRGAPIDLFERYELDIYEAANRKYDRGDVAPDGGVVVASGDLAAVTEPTLTGC